MTDEIKVHERIARLETLLEHHVTDEESAMAAMDAKLDRIELELSRYRGIVGGILLAVSSIATFLKFFGDEIMKILRG